MSNSLNEKQFHVRLPEPTWKLLQYIKLQKGYKSAGAVLTDLIEKQRHYFEKKKLTP